MVIPLATKEHYARLVICKEMTQQAVANECGVSQPAVYKWVKNYMEKKAIHAQGSAAILEIIISKLGSVDATLPEVGKAVAEQAGEIVRQQIADDADSTGGEPNQIFFPDAKPPPEPNESPLSPPDP